MACPPPAERRQQSKWIQTTRSVPRTFIRIKPVGKLLVSYYSRRRYQAELLGSRTKPYYLNGFGHELRSTAALSPLVTPLQIRAQNPEVVYPGAALRTEASRTEPPGHWASAGLPPGLGLLTGSVNSVPGSSN